MINIPVDLRNQPWLISLFKHRYFHKDTCFWFSFLSVSDLASNHWCCFRWPLDKSEWNISNIKQNDHILNAAAMNMISNFESHSLGTTASSEKAAKDLLANETQFGASHLQDGMEDDYKENLGHREGNIRRMRKTGASDKNCIQCSIKETSLRHGSRTSNVVFENIQSDGLSKSYEKCKTLIRKVALTDKLWDGRLLLNSSVTVSAVAFFKRSFIYFWSSFLFW